MAALSRDPAEGAAFAHEFAPFVEEALQSRRESGAKPSDDITLSLMAAEVNGKPLTDEDIARILRNWTAGHGTVSAGIEILMLHLAQHSEMQAKLRIEPE